MPSEEILNQLRRVNAESASNNQAVQMLLRQYRENTGPFTVTSTENNITADMEDDSDPEAYDSDYDDDELFEEEDDDDPQAIATEPQNVEWIEPTTTPWAINEPDEVGPIPAGQTGHVAQRFRMRHGFTVSSLRQYFENHNLERFDSETLQAYRDFMNWEASFQQATVLEVGEMQTTTATPLDLYTRMNPALMQAMDAGSVATQVRIGQRVTSTSSEFITFCDRICPSGFDKSQFLDAMDRAVVSWYQGRNSQQMPQDMLSFLSDMFPMKGEILQLVVGNNDRFSTTTRISSTTKRGAVKERLHFCTRAIAVVYYQYINALASPESLQSTLLRLLQQAWMCVSVLEPAGIMTQSARRLLEADLGEVPAISSDMSKCFIPASTAIKIAQIYGFNPIPPEDHAEILGHSVDRAVVEILGHLLPSVGAANTNINLAWLDKVTDLRWRSQLASAHTRELFTYNRLQEARAASMEEIKRRLPKREDIVYYGGRNQDNNLRGFVVFNERDSHGTPTRWVKVHLRDAHMDSMRGSDLGLIQDINENLGGFTPTEGEYRRAISSIIRCYQRRDEVLRSAQNEYYWTRDEYGNEAMYASMTVKRLRDEYERRNIGKRFNRLLPKMTAHGQYTDIQFDVANDDHYRRFTRKFDGFIFKNRFFVPLAVKMVVEFKPYSATGRRVDQLYLGFRAECMDGQRGNRCHPHSHSDGGFCPGSFREAVEAAINAGDFDDLDTQLLLMLNSYNGSSPYQELGSMRWPMVHDTETGKFVTLQQMMATLGIRR